ncbi:MAG: branched-chain amino acid ABC transporter permease [Desulfobacula sp.]|jgi:branched-chain amino acid transport system permease protein|uniref:branched-chain amino acid ABC transporter permease n=2 Tax=Desulfobacula sp. TaxID=2593537 RepID=UPI001D70C1D3|nr:branched-chain amino acid ABC transporter permease [Desulfobacula sp.]MBT3807350.1 branched-chain amino acid ABC transporter permease [Desulfobacula sp.]MBT4509030.1 branched-chain amino acid ABC transporter permease [Desulfobacula sp.]MBT7052178.1 branched-chain amino acid ABC transporter permease [Desulfobacula sp.]MBT7630461.1 branched-chain amino acid ABC transporter permease [Desulfobacula sp.]
METARKFIKTFSNVPMLGWLIGFFAAVLIEYYWGYDYISYYLGLPKIPVLFGALIMLKEPIMIPGAIAYDLIVYVIPILFIAKVSIFFTNRVAAVLEKTPLWMSAIIHLAFFYGVLHLWAGINDYRVLIVKLTLISIILTISINVINGYQGEFSCSHPGFMAIGAYISSILTLYFFVNDKTFGTAVLSSELGPWLFPIALIAGGVAASLGSLLVAIPSFRTRGDYLAIISLAFMFIVKSAVENLNVIGGARGMGGQPDYAPLPIIFIWTILCIWVVHNFVTSIMGKALNAVRDDEAASESMTVKTRKTKMTAFMFGAFWAGIAGGLFAHVLAYINPGMFSINRLAEILAMVYFGGLNSIIGSIVGAISINVLGEALRPLELFKWIIIPLILILVMIFRPYGLISFKEINAKKLLRSKHKREQGA